MLARGRCIGETLFRIDTELVSQIDGAYDRLLPNGLDVVNASYEAEAGNAAQMVKSARRPAVTGTRLPNVLACTEGV
ncbi:MAG: hypothetical protein ACMG6S_17360 [Byssovorax sp.]